MNRGIIALVVPLLAVCITAWAKGPMEIGYTTPDSRVNVSGDLLIYEARRYEFDKQGPSPNPTKLSMKRWRVSLPPGEARKLEALVRASGFFKLKAKYGAVSGPRRYIYSLHVRDGDRDKTVDYCSAPDNKNQAPADHQKIGAYLLGLARRLTSGVTPLVETPAPMPAIAVPPVPARSPRPR